MFGSLNRCSVPSTARHHSRFGVARRAPLSDTVVTHRRRHLDPPPTVSFYPFTYIPHPARTLLPYTRRDSSATPPLFISQD